MMNGILHKTHTRFFWGYWWVFRFVGYGNNLNTHPVPKSQYLMPPCHGSKSLYQKANAVPRKPCSLWQHWLDVTAPRHLSVNLLCNWLPGVRGMTMFAK